MDPGTIRQLDEATINRMAAGEVIVRPSNALKELIENSIDAKATSISVTVKSGGLQMLQITDNGTGIRKDDLPILCERFTTSKLSTFEDLSSIQTYGFRGEALCSISQVSKVEVVTKVRDSKCAFKANYELGKLIGSIKPSAGNQGTTITIEKMFYNLPTRLKSFGPPSAEEKLLNEVVTKYAVHNHTIALSIKLNAGKNITRTQGGSWTRTEVVKHLYGPEIASSLMEVQLTDANLQFSISGLISRPTFADKKKMVLLLFINNRLVRSKAIKAMVEEVYLNYLPHGKHPFVYLSLEIAMQNLDVNFSPTKSEVKFLHEDEIVRRISQFLDVSLRAKHSEKTLVQKVLPGASQAARSQSGKEKYPQEVKRVDSSLQKLDRFLTLSQVVHSSVLSSQGQSSSQSSTDDPKEVRDVEAPKNELDDSLESPIELEGPPEVLVESPEIMEVEPDVSFPQLKVEFFSQGTLKSPQDTSKPSKSPTETPRASEKRRNSDKCYNIVKENPKCFEEAASETVISDDEAPKRPRKVILDQIAAIKTAQSLREEAPSSSHDSFIIGEDMREYRKCNLTSVQELQEEIEAGVDPDWAERVSDIVFVGHFDVHIALIQHGTELYACKTAELMEELFYQRIITDIQNLGCIKLEPPLLIKNLAKMALMEISEDSPDVEAEAALVQTTLTSKTTILQEYFSVEISDKGELLSIPALIEDFMPPLANLPRFVLNLALCVEWEKEKSCFRSFAEITSRFYSKTFRNGQETEEEWKSCVEHVVYPAIRKFLLPSRRLVSQGAIKPVTSTVDLYKVFERC